MAAPELFIPTTTAFDDELSARTALKTGNVSWKLEIDDDDDGTYTDFTSYIAGNQITISAPRASIFKAGSAVSATILLRNTGGTWSGGDLANMPAKISVDIGGAGYIQIFSGYVSEKGCQRAKKSLTDDYVSVVLYDPSHAKGMRRKSNFDSYVNYYICNTASTSTSIAHKLAEQLGLSSGDLVFSDITSVKDYLPLDGKREIWKELQDLAIQHNAFLGFRYDGKLLLTVWDVADWNSPTPEYTFDENNVHSFRESGEDIFCNKAIVEFTEYQQLDPGIVFKSYDQWDETNQENAIVVAAGEYWPGGSDMMAIGRLNYQYGDEKYPIAISVQTPTVGTSDSDDIVCSGGTLTLVSFNGSNRLLRMSSSSYTDCVASDIGKTVTGGTSGYTGTLISYDNSTRSWWVETTDDWDLAESVTISGGTGAGTTTGGATTTNQNASSSEIVLYNGTGSAITITSFEIRGTALRELKKVRVEDVDPDIDPDNEEWKYVEKKIPGRYATSDSQAQLTCKRWVDFGKTARKRYEAVVDFTPNIQRGAFVTFNPTSGINLVCSVEAYRHTSKGPHTKTRTVVTLVERVDLASTGSGDILHDYAPANRPAEPDNTQEQLDDRPTYDEVINDGWDTGTGTTTPTVPTVVAYGLFNAIQLEWDRQNNLTNFDRYEVQVSPDNTTWYPLDLTGSGYDSGSPGGDTDWPVERLIHTKIPPSELTVTGDLTSGSAVVTNTDTTDIEVGDAVSGSGIPAGTTVESVDSSTQFTMSANATASGTGVTITVGAGGDKPQSTTYYYKVRRVTKSGTASAWSSVVSAATSLIANEDLPANIVKANKVETSFLNTLIAEIQSYLEISGDYGWLAGKYDAPASGDQRAYMDKNEFRLQIHDGSAWQDRFYVAASDGLDDYAAYFGCDVSAYTIKARDANGLRIEDDGGNLGLFVKDGGYVGVGTASPGCPLEIASGTDFPVTLKTSLDQAYVHGFEVLGSGLATGHHLVFAQGGVARSGYNEAYIAFYYAGLGSSSNRLGLGLWGVDDVLNITGEGYVGIGTTSPVSPLTVSGGSLSATGINIYPSGNSYNEGIRIHPSSNNDWSAIILGAVSGTSGTGTGQWAIGRAPSTSSYTFTVTYNSSKLFTITTSGYVGIGTTSPVRPLMIYSDQSGYGQLRITRKSSSAGEASMGFFHSESAPDTDAWVLGTGCWGNTKDFVIGQSGARFLIEYDSFVYKLGGAANGTNDDAYLYFASDAYLFWDESADQLILSKSWQVKNGSYTYTVSVDSSRADRKLDGAVGIMDWVTPTRSGLYQYIYSSYTRYLFNNIETTSTSYNDVQAIYSSYGNYHLVVNVSTRASKADIADIRDASLVHRLRPRRFRSTHEPVQEIAGREIWGFIAEEAADACEQFAVYGFDGTKRIVTGIDKGAILAATVAEVQKLRKDVDALKEGTAA